MFGVNDLRYQARSGVPIRTNRAGLTILELLVSLVVVAILAAISFQAFGTFKNRAEKLRCLANLKALHIGFDAYILDNNRWPQPPREAVGFDESEFFEWWVKELEPYGVGQETWLCPTDKVAKEDRDNFHAGSYIPTLFDSNQYTPYRWNQPWLIERGDFHGKGAHVLMPDGSITTTTNPFGGN